MDLDLAVMEVPFNPTPFPIKISEESDNVLIQVGENRDVAMALEEWDMDVKLSPMLILLPGYLKKRNFPVTLLLFPI